MANRTAIGSASLLETGDTCLVAQGNKRRRRTNRLGSWSSLICRPLTHREGLLLMAAWAYGQTTATGGLHDQAKRPELWR
ncbi:hypothetical protein GGTG_05254 [Gaeumannomyces tritici R3-111a-1]|uniref:Uncharacterized protein n=1 Tax=Gaeumannomyces tritici (strain R3-111a-1) TaxID=644352 RepID=J3NVE1_GAET3|nr:hypothetical protein GGTG_05254 [Gaeumannomyces tritici R3-111a-1]EJT75317.1 hypothetical protein GGTG_05254 [Gaeumannomyces tritici R3-111a-1]